MKFQEEKQTQPLTQDRTVTSEAAIPSSSSSCFGRFLMDIMLRNHISMLRICLQHNQHSSFTCSHHSHRQKDLETLKCQPLEKERFRNDEPLNGDQTVIFFFPIYTYSSLTQMPKNSATAQSKWTIMPCPFQSHVEQTPMPPQRKKDQRLEATLTGYPAALGLKPGLTLESPGVKTTRMLPPRSIDRLCGEGTDDVISKYSSCSTNGKLHGNHVANISSAASKCIQILGESGSHSKL